VQNFVPLKGYYKQERTSSELFMHRTDFARQPSVWLVGYPRSGNTWINFLCSYCLNLPFYDFDDLEAELARDWVRAAVAGKHDWPVPQGLHAVIKTHKLPGEVPYQTGRVIYLQRDPRDVFVSQSYFLTHRARKGRKRHLFRALGWLGKGWQIRWFVAQWQSHFQAWQPHAHATIHYDRLRKEGAAYLVQGLAQAGLAVAESKAQEALEFFKFEKMSEGRKSGEADQKSFFRRGAGGDWRDHLNEAEQTLFAPALAAAMKT
jgi:hypothetical protein